MSTPKLVAFFIAWVFASVTIGVVTAVVVAEFLTLIGLLETGSDGYNLALNIIALVVLVFLVSVPFVFRRRFIQEESDEV